MGSASELLTDAMPHAATPTPSSSSEEGRFPPGTILAERYRIVGLLGQGGMGEVYRANDLKLGQPVALKFLPQATAKNQQMLARFHAEARIARQVSHPNVCRVYDIGEADGSTFLSMEYVDGENLHSLLRRIGRLPPDKAVEIARKLCAGLAAAHDKGVLHRDLKPANIMIDGRGQVLIADFGLAALAGQLDGSNVRDGTPAYMAPEQLAGKEASVRSDLYALGLVLHEMFTGKRAFENGSERITPANVTSGVKDVDPLVERVIVRCLNVDPRNRPASAGRGCGVARRRSSGGCLGCGRYAHAGDGRRVGRYRGIFGARGRDLAGADPGGAGGDGRVSSQGQRAGADALRKFTRCLSKEGSRSDSELRLRRAARRPRLRLFLRPRLREIRGAPGERRGDSGPVRKRLSAGDPILVSTKPSAPAVNLHPWRRTDYAI
jgi:predicted Ser/Thr protein kinase